MTVIGDFKINARLGRLKHNLQKRVGEANSRSGKQVVRVAKALIPVESGDSQDEIEATDFSDGSTLVSFGSKAKVIEGDNGPRPFVNPSLKATRKARRKRNERAVKLAVKDTFNGG